jgi:16S rRNA (cytidine1402-2'-O)-methyltransferase
LDLDRFSFFGFPPRSGKERQKLLERIAVLEETVVMFEAPGRVARLLEDLAEVCGGERSAAVARELTKVHETFMRGTLSELAAYYRTDAPRGEVVVMVAGGEAEPAVELKPEAGLRAAELLQSGASARDVARQLTQELGISRNHAYQITQSLSRGEG